MLNIPIKTVEEFKALHEAMAQYAENCAEVAEDGPDEAQKAALAYELMLRFDAAWLKAVLGEAVPSSLDNT